MKDKMRDIIVRELQLYDFCKDMGVVNTLACLITNAIYQTTRLDPEKMSALINPDNTNFKDYDKVIIELICLKQDELTKE